ncbi:MAG: DUF3530 family protein [Colwellia sp.]
MIKTTKTDNYITIHTLVVTIFLMGFLICVKPSLASNKASLPTNQNVDKFQQHQGDIGHFLHKDQVDTLLAGPDSYLMLINENTHVVNKGIMVIIPDWEQAVIHPKAPRFLQNIFPQNGWTTIAVYPPAKPLNYPSITLDKVKQAQENDSMLSAYTEKLSVLIKAVIKRARNYPGHIFIISQGNNAAIIANILAQNEHAEGDEFTVDGIILLSSFLHSDENNIDSINSQFANTLAHSDIPILDLTLRHDHLIVQKKADERSVLAKRERKVFYRHRMLNNVVAGVYPEQDLISQIKRWLVSIGW